MKRLMSANSRDREFIPAAGTSQNLFEMGPLETDLTARGLPDNLIKTGRKKFI